MSGLVKGARAVAVKLFEGQEFPDDVVPMMRVDIVGEISEPVKTGVGLLNVRVLAVDGVPVEKERAGRWVVFELTPGQVEVLTLMKKNAMKLELKKRTKEDRNKAN
jgi:Flp pilus assembly protein CpaB